MYRTDDIRVERHLQRFVLMFYPELAKEILVGWGEKLEMLRQLTGHRNRTTFLQLCRQELAEARGPGLFAETMMEQMMVQCSER